MVGPPFRLLAIDVTPMNSSGSHKLGALLAVALCLNWWPAVAQVAQELVPGSGRVVNGDVSTILPCLEELTPCQGEEKAAEVSPRCCQPLLYLVAHDAECLCAIFFNDGLLANFDLSREQVLVMSRKCDARIPENYCANYVNATDATKLSPAAMKELSPPVPVEELQGSNADSRGRITMAKVMAIIVINMMMFLILIFKQ